MRSRTLVVLALAALATLVRPQPATAQALPQAAGAALTGVVSVASGTYQGCAVVGGGQVRCWGSHGYGGLGNDTFGAAHSAAVVVKNVAGTGPLTGVRMVAAGDYHACALLTNGQVRCWGDNSYGQLGDGSQDESHRPLVVENAGGTGPLTGVSSISAAGRTTCATLTNGQARCWGRGSEGELGNGGARADRPRPTPVVGIGGTGRLTGVVQVDVGYRTVCARLANRQARCWGSNVGGQLGIGTITAEPLNHPSVVRNPGGSGPLQKVASISTGSDHACALLTDGSARCWGYNLAGKLGDGTDDQHPLPVVVRNAANNGPLRGIVELDAAAFHTCARRTDGRVRCWGQNDLGQLGSGAALPGVDQLLPVAVRNAGNDGELAGVTQMDVTDMTTCVRLQNGQARCWGTGEDGNLGNGSSTPAASVPVKVRIAT
jgi:alpha-tubulin suppressor-like RCC1 family protein